MGYVPASHPAAAPPSLGTDQLPLQSPLRFFLLSSICDGRLGINFELVQVLCISQLLVQVSAVHSQHQVSAQIALA